MIDWLISHWYASIPAALAILGGLARMFWPFRRRPEYLPGLSDKAADRRIRDAESAESAEIERIKAHCDAGRDRANDKFGGGTILILIVALGCGPGCHKRIPAVGPSADVSEALAVNPADQLTAMCFVDTSDGDGETVECPRGPFRDALVATWDLVEAAAIMAARLKTIEAVHTVKLELVAGRTARAEVDRDHYKRQRWNFGAVGTAIGLVVGAFVGGVVAVKASK